MKKATKDTATGVTKRVRGARPGRPPVIAQPAAGRVRSQADEKPDAVRSPALAAALGRLHAAPAEFLSWVGEGQPWPVDGPEILGRG